MGFNPLLDDPTQYIFPYIKEWVEIYNRKHLICGMLHFER